MYILTEFLLGGMDVQVYTALFCGGMGAHGRQAKRNGLLLMGQHD